MTGRNISRRALCGALVAAPLAAPMVARAQGAAWPSATMRMVVPFTPGGSTDVLARLVASRLERVLGRPMIVENRPGAGGSVAAGQVARADADGHTLMMGHIGTLAFNPSLYPTLPYDPVRDFAPVALVASVPNILAVTSGLPARTFAEFLAYARANPGKLNYSSGGLGSAAHIAGAYLVHKAGLDAVHVPYRGTAPSVNDLVAGQIQFTLTGGPALLPLAATGRLRILGVASLERVGFAPTLPTIAESGLPGFEAIQWYGVVAPARTPPAIVQRLNAEINALLDQPDFRETLDKEGAVSLRRTPGEFGALIASEIPLWRDIIRQSAIRAE